MRRGSAVGGLVLVAGMLAGCGEAEALPNNLCDLVGEDVIAQMVPGAVVEPPYRSKQSGLNTISCDAASPKPSPDGSGGSVSGSGGLHVLLERHGPCKSIRPGETVCNPRETNAERSFESHCESLLINPERYGREVKVDGLGDHACATVAEADPETTAHLVVHKGGDVLVIRYTVQPSKPKPEIAGTARTVAEQVLKGLKS